MLKRSFAEFHAQKKLPEQQQLLMRKLAQPTKTIEYVSRILVINGHILFTINILYFRLQCMLVLQMFCLVWFWIPKCVFSNCSSLTVYIISLVWPPMHEDKLLSLSGVKAPGLLSNWFWRVGSVAHKSLINSENCFTLCSTQLIWVKLSYVNQKKKKKVRS